MTQRINYEDDIFILTLIIRTLRDITGLEADADLFRDKILGDIYFIDATMERIYESLKEFPSFLRRQEHLKDLRKLKTVLMELLDDIREGRTQFSNALQEHTEKLHAIREAHARDVAEIRDLLSRSAAGPAEGEQMVSEQELKILLSEDEGSAPQNSS